MGNSSYSEKGRQGLGNDKIGMINKKQWLDPKYPHKEKLRAREHVFSGQVIEKSLCQIPSHFGIEMTDRGWILRNSLVWIKPNAMPESVQDRWKKAHEYIFFFVKSKKYNFNLDSIRTPHKQISIKRAEYEIGRNALGLNPSNTGEKYNRDKKNKDGTEKYYSMPARQVKLNPKGAIPPDYLSINTNCSEQDTVEGHWATFPQSLIIPLIKAGCPEGGIVLDMFSGSCTTALVSEKLNRKWIMIDLSSRYCEIGQERMDNFIKQKRLF
jgi:DNA modification methylase